MTTPLFRRSAFLCFLFAPALLAQDATTEKKDLRAFFQVNCSVCHGPDGSAMGADGTRLKGQDFTNAKEMKNISDADMVKTIRKGLFFGKRMPSFKSRLTDEEIQQMVTRVLRKVEKGKVIAPEAAPAK